MEGQPALPSPFGRYTLIERLAVGGMAEVFRAKIVSSHGFEKALVIKRILPQLAADRTFVSMFIDEAKLTAQLVHPKVVQVLDFGEVAGQYFIALELVDGYDALALLRQCAGRRVRMPLSLGVHVAMEVLDALDYAHNATDPDGRPLYLVHRDISPSNIFVSKRGDVKLGDFGIARAEQRESKTQAGTLKGKYGYMSPEQVLGAAVDRRSDVFAVGIVLAEMFMGRRLFTARNDLDVLLMVRDGQTERLERYAADLPAELLALVRKALKKDPAQRFPTAQAFREALGDYGAAQGWRLSAAAVKAFIDDLFDLRPEAQARLARHARASESAAPPPAPLPGAAHPPRDVDPGAPVSATPLAERPAPLATPPPARHVEAPGPALAPLPVPAGLPRSVAHQAAAEPIASALESASLAVVDLDQWGTEPPAAEKKPAAAVRGAPAAEPAGPSADVGRFVSAVPARTPDAAGELATLGPMRVLASLALARESGLVAFTNDARKKEIYLVQGSPEYVDSSVAGERFGAYLVTRGVLRAADLDQALAALPRFSGKLGDTLVGLGLLRPLDVFRLLSEQVKDRVIEVFSWTRGRFAFYRGVRNEQGSFPLGLDTFEIMGAGVLTLSFEQLSRRFAAVLDRAPVRAVRVRVEPEAFHLGPTPRDVWQRLEAGRTLRAWLGQRASSDEALTFLRTLALLVDAELARFE
jgi:serine/threonine-protein kinase